MADELGYDSYNKNADRIFRVNSHYKIGGNRFNLANSPVPLAAILQSEYPEVEKTVRLFRGENIYVKKNDEYIKEENFLYADSSMFDVFTIDFVSGNPAKSLLQPNSVVITTKAAEEVFCEVIIRWVEGLHFQTGRNSLLQELLSLSLQIHISNSIFLHPIAHFLKASRQTGSAVLYIRMF